MMSVPAIANTNCMEPYQKDESAHNNIGRELFVSADSSEVIPEQMMDIEDDNESEETAPDESRGD